MNARQVNSNQFDFYPTPENIAKIVRSYSYKVLGHSNGDYTFIDMCCGNGAMSSLLKGKGTYQDIQDWGIPGQIVCDLLQMPVPEQKFDIGVINPPFNANGKPIAEEFLMHSLKYCKDLIAIVPIKQMTGSRSLVRDYCFSPLFSMDFQVTVPIAVVWLRAKEKLISRPTELVKSRSNGNICIGDLESYHDSDAKQGIVFKPNLLATYHGVGINMTDGTRYWMQKVEAGQKRNDLCYYKKGCKGAKAGDPYHLPFLPLTDDIELAYAYHAYLRAEERISTANDFTNLSIPVWSKLNEPGIKLDNMLVDEMMDPIAAHGLENQSFKWLIKAWDEIFPGCILERIYSNAESQVKCGDIRIKDGLYSYNVDVKAIGDFRQIMLSFEWDNPGAKHAESVESWLFREYSEIDYVLFIWEQGHILMTKHQLKQYLLEHLEDMNESKDNSHVYTVKSSSKTRCMMVYPENFIEWLQTRRYKYQPKPREVKNG